MTETTNQPTHTPGPWEWTYAIGMDRKPNDYEAEYLNGADGVSVISLKDDYPGYAECGEHLIMEIEPADARLIAAAPDMAEALVKISKGEGPLADDRTTHYWNVIQSNIEIAKAALAKAGLE